MVNLNIKIPKYNKLNINIVIEDDLERNTDEIKELLKKFQECIIIPEDHKENKEKMRKVLGNRIPPEFVCSITGEIFVDPVMTSDGQTYERFAIQEWFKNGHVKSPLSGVHLSNTQLIPNNSLRKLIDEYRKLNFI